MKTKATSIKELLKKKEEKRMLQVRIDLSLYNKVDRQRRKLGVSMTDVVTASLNQFLVEIKK